MKFTSSRVETVAPSATMAMTQEAARRRAAGEDVIAFSAGEPDFDTPAHIIDAAKKALDAGLTRYTSVMGTPTLRQAVARLSHRVRQRDCQSEQVIVGVGAKHILYNFFMAVLDPGDEVIIPAPYWVSYPDQVRLAGGTPVIAPTRDVDGWMLTPETLRATITPRSKVLVLNTPSNPTGSVYSRRGLETVVNTALDMNLLIVSDEIYRDLMYDDVKFVSPLTVAARHRNRVFVVDGVSKTFAMTGWRIGWGIGDPQIIAAMGKIQGQSTSNATSFAQAAAHVAIEDSLSFLAEWKQQYVARRNIMVERLNAMEGVTCRTPTGAFYVFPHVAPLVQRLGRDKTDVALAEWFLKNAGIATVPGTSFGAPGHLRLSYATSLDQVESGLQRMAHAVRTLIAAKN